MRIAVVSEFRYCFRLKEICHLRLDCIGIHQWRIPGKIVVSYKKKIFAPLLSHFCSIHQDLQLELVLQSCDLILQRFNGFRIVCSTNILSKTRKSERTSLYPLGKRPWLIRLNTKSESERFHFLQIHLTHFLWILSRQCSIPLVGNQLTNP